MKIKIDENLPVEIADDLRALGHDAMTVVDHETRVRFVDLDRRSFQIIADFCTGKAEPLAAPVRSAV